MRKVHAYGQYLGDQPEEGKAWCGETMDGVASVAIGGDLPPLRVTCTQCQSALSATRYRAHLNLRRELDLPVYH